MYKLYLHTTMTRKNQLDIDFEILQKNIVEKYHSME